jgi:OOP family OmpA-OmpF porin
VEVVKHVQVKDDQIVIDEKIQFSVNKSDILPASNGLLDEIASTMKEHPEIKKVEVQGHASSEGGADLNKKLSDARAKAVAAALVTRGIPADALTAKGYGIDVPLGDNKTEEGREKNRRVEFHITDPAPKGGAGVTSMAPDGKVGKKKKDDKTTTATPGPKPVAPKKDEKKKP